MEIESLVRHLDLRVQFETMLDQAIVTSASTYERIDDTASYSVYEGRAAVIAAPGTGGVLSPGVSTSFGIRVGLLAIYAIEDVAKVDTVTSTVTVNPYAENVGFYNQLIGKTEMLADHPEWFTGVKVEWLTSSVAGATLTPANPSVDRVLSAGTHDIRLTLLQASDVPWVASGDPSAVTRVVVL